MNGGVQQEQQLSFFAGSLGGNFSRGLRRRMKEAFEPPMKADRLTNVDSDKAGAAMCVNQIKNEHKRIRESGDG